MSGAAPQAGFPAIREGKGAGEGEGRQVGGGGSVVGNGGAVRGREGMKSKARLDLRAGGCVPVL